jgi:uncharacterized membrane protein
MRASKRARNNPLASPKNAEGASDTNVTKVEHASWAGPLPPPAILEQFNQIVENGAERIFSQWELETAHPRAYEASALRGSMWLDGIGRVTAFTFAMAALVVTAWAAWIGQSWVATVLGGGTIAAVAAALVYRGKTERHSQSIGRTPPGTPPR